jgi:S1-C subfamily serine protease
MIFTVNKTAVPMRTEHSTRTRFLFSLVAVLVLGLLISGCSRKYVQTERGPQAYYQTGFPVHDTSRELEQAFRSIKRIEVTGYYRTYRFPQTSSIRMTDLQRRDTFLRAVEEFTFDYTKSGTAVIVSATSSRMALLTNDHVIDFPDTIVQYYSDPAEPSIVDIGEQIVESVSVKINQVNLVYDVIGFYQFHVLVRDSQRDIALLGTDAIEQDSPGRFSTLRFQPGDPTRLSWGSFVYILGYPRGYKMVTRGIVSDPNRDRQGSFLLDGLFNRGISGGVILAVRGDTGELEWVGMARAGSSQTELLLTPERRKIDEHGILLPYEGKLYIERKPRIDYGITISVPMTSIQDFFSRHERQILRHGFHVPLTTVRSQE